MVVGGRLRPGALGRQRLAIGPIGLLTVGLAAVVVATSLGSPGATAASGSAVSAKRREAAKLAASIDTTGDRLSALAEDENEANVRLAQLESRLQKGEAELSTADDLSAKMEVRARRAALSALGEPFANVGVFVEGAGAMDERERSVVLEQRARERDRNALDALRAAREDINRKRNAVASARRETEQLKSLLAKRRKDADRLLVRFEKLQVRAQGELKTLMVQAEKDRLAGEAQRERQLLAARQASARRTLEARRNQVERDSVATRANAVKKKAIADKRLADLRRKGAKASPQEVAAAREAAADAESVL